MVSVMPYGKMRVGKEKKPNEDSEKKNNLQTNLVVRKMPFSARDSTTHARVK